MPSAYQIAIALLHDIAEMDADAKLDAPIGWQPGIALDHAVLHFDSTAYRLDNAAKFDERAVARTLDDPTVMYGDGGIDQITPERSQPRQRSILIGAGELAESDDIGRQNRRNLPRLAHIAL